MYINKYFFTFRKHDVEKQLEQQQLEQQQLLKTSQNVN